MRAVVLKNSSCFETKRTYINLDLYFDFSFRWLEGVQDKLLSKGKENQQPKDARSDIQAAYPELEEA
jgi:hypothetical protein